jgi:hypothetical protein
VAAGIYQFLRSADPFRVVLECATASMCFLLAQCSENGEVQGDGLSHRTTVSGSTLELPKVQQAFENIFSIENSTYTSGIDC